MADEREKGVLNLIQAIPLVLDKLPIDLVICGDGSLRQEIADFVSSTKQPQRIHIEGWVNHEKLPKYLNEFKLLVLLSYTETMGYVVLEAMACGTPVLMTRVGAIADLATDGKEVFFLTSNDHQRDCRSNHDESPLGLRIYPGLAHLLRYSYSSASTMRLYFAIVGTQF